MEKKDRKSQIMCNDYKTEQIHIFWFHFREVKQLIDQPCLVFFRGNET